METDDESISTCGANYNSDGWDNSTDESSSDYDDEMREYSSAAEDSDEESLECDVCSGDSECLDPSDIEESVEKNVGSPLATTRY